MQFIKNNLSKILVFFIFISFFGGGLASFIINFHKKGCIIRVGLSCKDDVYLAKKIYKISKLNSMHEKKLNTLDIKRSIEDDFVSDCMKKDLNISIPDDIVFEEIKQEPSFKTNGIFDTKKYDFFLDFYKIQPKDSILDKEQELISIFVNDMLSNINFLENLDFLNKIYGNKIEYTLNLFSKSLDNIKINEIDDKRILDFYNKNEELFYKPKKTIIKKLKLPNAIFFKNNLSNVSDIKKSDLEKSISIFLSNQATPEKIALSLKIEPKFEVVERDSSDNDKIGSFYLNPDRSIDFIDKITEPQKIDLRSSKKYIIDRIKNEDRKNILMMRLNSKENMRSEFFDVQKIKIDNVGDYRNTVELRIQNQINNNGKLSISGIIGPFYIDNKFIFAEIINIENQRLDPKSLFEVYGKTLNRDKFIQYEIYHKYLLNKCGISINIEKLEQLLSQSQ